MDERFKIFVENMYTGYCQQYKFECKRNITLDLELSKKLLIEG